MLIWRLIAAAAGFAATPTLAAAVMGDALDSNEFACGPSPSDKFKEISKRFAQEEALERRLGQRSAQEINVSVYIHIVARSRDEADGYLSVSHIIFFSSSFTLPKYDPTLKQTGRMRPSTASFKFSVPTMHRPAYPSA